ncbi:MAG: ABC transporter ATP-binding protein [Anaerovoracaceae bacterium]|jgi:branched-chain amino acid transport system ATP-binding protein
MNTILKVENIHAGYGPIKIIPGLSFEVEEGQVLGVIGPNGAGKTTLMNALIGLITPTEGKIIFEGRDITKLAPDERCRIGFGRTYQIPRPFENMTVYENVLVGSAYGDSKTESAARKRCIEALHTTNLYNKKDIVAGQLALLDRKRLEIARALGTNPKILLLDEVAAGLTDSEVHDVMDLVADLKALGITIIWIEHVIKTMVESTDKLLCMAEGCLLKYGDPLETMNCQEVQDVYLGVEED